MACLNQSVDVVARETTNRNSPKLLIEAAIPEFAQFGYAGARTERIADRAGVNKQLLFYYFGTKAGLYRAVIDEAVAQLDRAARNVRRAPEHAAGRLRHELKAAFVTLAESPDLARLLVRGTFDRHEDTAADLPARSLAGRLAQAVSDGQGLGHYRDDADPHTVARQAVVLLLGYFALEGSLTQNGPAEGCRAAWLNEVSSLLARSLSW
jgi:TetR/AcrR family transcriptional regulator